MLYDIQQKVNDYIEDTDDVFVDEETGLILNSDDLEKIIAKTSVPDDAKESIKQSYQENFGEQLPEASNLIDTKLLEVKAKAKEHADLMAEVAELKQQIETHKTLHPEDDSYDDGIKTYDVVLRVKPEKVSQIKSQIVDGQKCLVIPMEENEHAAVNGVNTQI